MEFIVVIGTIQSFLAKWGERLNFGNTVAKIVRKIWERRKLSDMTWREKKWISVMVLSKFVLVPKHYPWSAPMGVPEWDLPIVATKLPKL